MPRDAGGNYTLPAGNPVVTGTVITSSWANPTMSDIANEITNSLSRNGQGGMLAPLTFADGTVNDPPIAFTQEPTLGIYRVSSGLLAIAGQGKDVARFNANSGQIALRSGISPGVLLIPDATGGFPVFSLTDENAENRFTITLDVTTGASTIARKSDAGALETLLSFDDVGNVNVNGAAPLTIADLTRKDYVDTGDSVNSAEASAANDNANTRILRAGDTMTGQLAGITPVDDEDLTRKDYVDAAIAAAAFTYPAQAANHIRMGSTQRHDGIGALVAISMQTAGNNVPFTLGKTGSGATFEWTALDDIDDTCVGILVNAFAEQLGASTADASISVFAANSAAGLTASSNIKNLIWHAYSRGTAGLAKRPFHTEAIVTRDTAGLFHLKVLWINNNPATPSVQLYYRGFLTDPDYAVI